MAVHLQGNPADMDPILAIARKHSLKVLEDGSQSVGASYKGRPLGSMGDIGIYSLQQSKTITAGEGGALVTSDPYLFERACRFHDVTRAHAISRASCDFMPGLNYRMNEFTGGVLLAQLRKLDTIIGDVRRNARRVYSGIRDVPGARMRRLPDPQGELGTGIFLGFRHEGRAPAICRRDEGRGRAGVGSRRFGNFAGGAGDRAEGDGDAAVAVSFNSDRGKAIRYGRECCPRTIDILGRFAGVMMNPKYTERDTDDAIAAVRKVHPAIVRA